MAGTWCRAQPARRAVAAAALALATGAALAACGTSPPVVSSPVGSAAPVITAAPSTTPSPTTTSAAGTGAGAGDATDLAACADGTCRVEVRPGDAITFDGSVRVDRLVVTGVGDGQVTVSASTGPGSRSTQSSSVGSENTLNGLSYRIESVRGDTAVVDFSRS